MQTNDAYIRYTRNFFRRWVRLYDYFAASVFFVYRAAVKQVQPAPGKLILDICTGTGEVAIRCARKGGEVTAIDITQEMLEKARSKAGTLPIAFQLMDARSLAFADCSFDTTVISFALHDMPRRVRLEVLCEAARVTQNRLVIADYDLPQWAPLRRVLIRMINLFESPYFRSFAREGAMLLLKESNFRDVQVHRLWMRIFSVYVIELSSKPVP